MTTATITGEWLFDLCRPSGAAYWNELSAAQQQRWNKVARDFADRIFWAVREECIDPEGIYEMQAERTGEEVVRRVFDKDWTP